MLPNSTLPNSSVSNIGKTVGERLRAVRRAYNHTQSQLAAPDFSVSYISAIERGQIYPSLRALEILAGRLGLSTMQLLPPRTQEEDQVAPCVSTAERETDEVVSGLLEAELLIRQGEALQAIAHLEKFSTQPLKQSQQLLHRYLLGWAYFEEQKILECEYTLEEARHLAEDRNESYLYVRILNLLGIANAALFNHERALMYHQRCLNLLESAEPRDLFMIAQVYMHIGQHYEDLEKSAQALEMFNKALEMTAPLSTLKGSQENYWHLCQYYANARDAHRATQYAYKSLHLYQQEASKHLRSTLHAALAQAMMKMDPEQAQVYLDEVLQQKNGEKDPLVLASVSTHKAEWHFSRQEFAEAEQYARRAYEEASSLGAGLVAAEALIMLGRIEYVQGNDSSGDIDFVNGLEMLERLKCQKELEEQSIRYAELLEQGGRAREALQYFRRAFEAAIGE
jgi:tetratricopeptide (TPR) repeat protein